MMVPGDFMAKSLLGKLKPTAIGMTELPRLDARILGGFRELGDLTGTTSDALDECGIAGAVPASLLKPTDPGARVVGQAITVLNRKVGEMRKVSGLADIEAHNLAEAGDVLVVQGVAGISSMGGVSASIGKRQGEAGAIVDGAVRDVDHSRDIGYPIWCAGVSPITGKWRIETMAVNDPVHIAGVEVKPGDLVIADECGVCFVPFARAAEVLAVAQRLAASEARRLKALGEGIPLSEFVKLPR
jgi:regulator of RNase E activity RraA